MDLKGRKTDPVRLTLRRGVMLVLVALIFFGSAGVWSAFHKERESATLRVQSQGALADLTAQQQQLQKTITELQSKQGQEAALRQQYAVGKPGEGMIVIVNPAQTTPVQATTTLLQKIEQTLWWW